MLLGIFTLSSFYDRTEVTLGWLGTNGAESILLAVSDRRTTRAAVVYPSFAFRAR